MNTDNEKIIKSVAISKAVADAAKDIDLINQFAMKTLTPEDVFCFSVVLSNNEVDRDVECMSVESLKALATMMVGRTGIMDHHTSAKNQVARLYKTELVDAGGVTTLGEPLKQLVGYAYMLKNETTQPMIDSIEGGITKEVSIGFSCQRRVCSICGKDLKLDWRTWTFQCETGHIKGQEYDGKLCAGVLEDVTDAYEFSFVAVPANRGAGVSKGFEPGTSIYEAFLQIPVEKLAECPGQNEAVIKHLQMANASADERAKRAAIRKYAEENF